MVFLALKYKNGDNEKIFVKVIDNFENEYNKEINVKCYNEKELEPQVIIEYNDKIVSDDLYKNGIFDDNDNEIANNIARKVTIPDENKQIKNKKKNNDTRF